MKRASIILILFLISLSSMAQDQKNMDRIRAARIALITERLNLTPDQAEKFWPVYRQYEMERREIRKEFRDARQNVDMKNLTEEQSQQLMKKSME